MSALRVTQAYYEGLQNGAAQAAARTLGEAGIDVTLLRYSRRVDEAVADQWQERQVEWDWSEITRKYRGPKSFCVAMWSPGDRLSGVAMMTVSPEAVTVKFVEGDPRPDCPLIGRRALIALEVATNYAQQCGINEIRIHPVNVALARFYETVFGFELVKPHKEEPYYRKRI